MSCSDSILNIKTMAIDLKAYQRLTEFNREKKQSASWLMSMLNKDIQLFGGRIGDKIKEQFYSQLFLLLSAGVDMKSALELFVQTRKRKREKLVFDAIREKVIGGSSLSDAMGTERIHFTEYERFGVMIGEESGKLNDVLREQSDYFSKKIKQRRQFVSVLTYPAVVFVVAIGAVFFMMRFIVPMFSDVFKRFGGDLPELTRMVLHVSDLFSDYGYLILSAILLGVVLTVTQSKKEWFRAFGSKIVLRIPVLNQLILKIYLTRFCQAMSLLLSSKTPLVKAIDLARNMVGFYPIERSLEVVREDILRGESLNKSLSKFAIYDPSFLALLRAAEEVNKVDVIFGKLAKQYSDEVEQQSGVFGALIEPVIIVFLGLLVAVILVAMYLPLFQLSTTIN